MEEVIKLNTELLQEFPFVTARIGCCWLAQYLYITDCLTAQPMIYPQEFLHKKQGVVPPVGLGSSDASNTESRDVVNVNVW